QYNEKNGLLLQEKSVGTDELPSPVKEGWVISKYEYDDFGRMIRNTLHGIKEEPVVDKKAGYHGWKARYDDRGNQIQITYLDKDDNATLLDDGYATLKATYDVHGKMTRGSYYGVNGEADLCKENYHGLKVQYDDRGN